MAMGSQKARMSPKESSVMTQSFLFGCSYLNWSSKADWPRASMFPVQLVGNPLECHIGFGPRPQGHLQLASGTLAPVHRGGFISSQLVQLRRVEAAAAFARSSPGTGTRGGFSSAQRGYLASAER